MDNCINEKMVTLIQKWTEQYDVYCSSARSLVARYALSVTFTLRSIEYQLPNADYRKREEAYDVNVYVLVLLIVAS